MRKPCLLKNEKIIKDVIVWYENCHGENQEFDNENIKIYWSKDEQNHFMTCHISQITPLRIMNGENGEKRNIFENLYSAICTITNQAYKEETVQFLLLQHTGLNVNEWFHLGKKVRHIYQDVL
jgi:hypothetical protein